MAAKRLASRRVSRSRLNRAGRNGARASADQRPSAAEELPPSILTIDVGGTKLKVLATGETEPRKIGSGKRMTPARMVEAVREVTHDWTYEAVSIGFPGLVGSSGPRSEPGNLGGGWVGFDYAAALGLPVRIVNDAVMQAVGSYEGGRMLFLGLGTGLGSALIAANVVVSLELGLVPAGGALSLGDIVGRAGLKSLGKKLWREAVIRIATALLGAFIADYVVLGGGNAKLLKDFPPGIRLGHNLAAFRGGYRLWHLEDVPTLSGHDGQPAPSRLPAEWRVI